MANLNGGAGFGEDVNALYAILSDQHRHPRGPWPLMTEMVRAMALPKGAVLLDLASGMGEPAASIASVFPDLRVISTDVSEDMVSKASTRAAALPNMTAQRADMQDLAGFDDNSVDVVTSCYGFMFPDDKAKAVREVARVLKPGGRLIVTWWEHLAIVHMGCAVMQGVLGLDKPPPPAYDPYTLHEPGVFDAFAEAAGLVKASTETSVYPYDFGTDPDMAYALGTLIAKQTLDKLGKQEEGRRAWDANVDKFSKIDERGHRVLDGNRFVFASYTKPA